MLLRIKISSKSKKELKQYLKFLNRLNVFFSPIKQVVSLRKHHVITVLKSPHVNKTAQEQFDFRIFSSIIFINSVQNYKNIIFISKIQQNSFPGIKTSIIFSLNFPFNTQQKKLKPDLKIVRAIPFESRKSFLNSKSYFKYIQSYDSFGEILVQKFLNKN